MNILRNTLILLAAAVSLCATAQSRSVRLTVTVTTVEGDNLQDQPLTLTQTDYSADYPGLRLDGDGKCAVNVYPGNHTLTIARDGFETVTHPFFVTETPAEQSVAVTLTEKTRQPFALKADLLHDAMTGRNDISLSWNTEAPIFFDDFESYDPFAISFGQWTGIDADGEPTAALAGSYPNRGIMQYAQVINPLAVTPVWWYEYPVLRPYSGQQYLGFIRTASGNANDDWLISPVITPGTDNLLEFKAKAADQYPERFMVYVTTVTDNPGPADFTRLDTGNYESVDYTGWRDMSYDLSAYAGREIRFAIRYISHASRNGAFMLMIDDVYVGGHRNGAEAMQTRRVAARSPENVNESFQVYLDGVHKGTTYGYSYLLSDVTPGEHTLGVQARYLQAQSEMSTVTATVPADVWSAVTFNVTAESSLAPDGQKIELVNIADATAYTLTVADGKATVPSLPYGTYEANIAEGAYASWHRTIEVNTPTTTVEVTLTDNIISPWNITASQADNGDIAICWNQNLGFTDSFEEYDDFATGSFGDWTTVDSDRMPVYPIGLGSTQNIVSFPGSGNAANPVAIAPMVFNPWQTVPAMLPTDPAIAASDGDKCVIFFSPQMAQADKWLISPELDIRPGYEFSFLGKAYTAMYAESMELCVSENGAEPGDFTPLATVDRLSAEQWSRYSTPLDAYAGRRVRVAVHYTSYDSFLAQVDRVSVGPAEGETDIIDYGNVIRYEIYVDGTLHGTSQTPRYTATGLTPGRHTIGIKAVYLNGESDMTEYTIDVAGITAIISDGTDGPDAIYDLAGRRVDPATAAPGIYISVSNGQPSKTILR